MYMLRTKANGAEHTNRNVKQTFCFNKAGFKRIDAHQLSLFQLVGVIRLHYLLCI